MEKIIIIAILIFSFTSTAYAYPETQMEKDCDERDGTSSADRAYSSQPRNFQASLRGPWHQASQWGRATQCRSMHCYALD